MMSGAARPGRDRGLGRRLSAAFAAGVLALLAAGAAVTTAASSASASSRLGPAAFVPAVVPAQDPIPPDPPTVNAVPVADFTFAPASPVAGQAVTFTSTSTDLEGALASVQWDLDNDGVFDDGNGTTASRAFPTSGSFTVGVLVTDAQGAQDVKTRTVAIANKPPTASFKITPTVAPAGSQVTFESTSTDADGTITRFAWDLDNDGAFDDGRAPTAARVYATTGTQLVRLRVTDNGGAQATASGTLTVVADQAPIAGFTFTPTVPHVGETVALRSTSTDPDGSLQGLAWDLNGDGSFTDASGATAVQTFSTPGPHMVQLKATDDRKVSTTAFQTINVVATAAGQTPSAASASASPAAARPSVRRLSMLAPSPIVRISGTILRGGVLVRILSVRAGARTTVEVSCKGRSCPVRKAVERVLKVARTVRFHAYERRLRAGVVLEIRIMRRDRIGKYTRFVIRGFAAPARRDMCLRWPSRTPSRCPDR
jgi:PKD repeat protein